MYFKCWDHPKIKHPSWINYYESEEINQYKLLKECMNKSIKMDQDISDDILIRIQNGARQTSHLKGKFKKYFNYF